MRLKRVYVRGCVTGCWTAKLSITRLSRMRLKRIAVDRLKREHCPLNNKTLKNEIETKNREGERAIGSDLSITRLSRMRLKQLLRPATGPQFQSLSITRLSRMRLKRYADNALRILRVPLNNKTLKNEIETLLLSGRVDLRVVLSITRLSRMRLKLWRYAHNTVIKQNSQ